MRRKEGAFSLGLLVLRRGRGAKHVILSRQKRHFAFLCPRRFVRLVASFIAPPRTFRRGSRGRRHGCGRPCRSASGAAWCGSASAKLEGVSNTPRALVNLVWRLMNGAYVTDQTVSLVALNLVESRCGSQHREIDSPPDRNIGGSTLGSISPNSAQRVMPAWS